MTDYYEQFESPPLVTVQKKDNERYLLHIGLFILTFLTSTLAGAFWVTGRSGPYDISFIWEGLPYSISIMFIITCHEFGHYFAAKHHKVKATLPFYVPLPPIPFLLNFGTMGAVIKTKSPIRTNKAMFDIGVAGPLAGFIATLIVLIIGFNNLPGFEHILEIHPNYYSEEFRNSAGQLSFGSTILFEALKGLFVGPSEFFPPMSEVYHSPYLCAGWFGMLVTAMNMIPVGQLDGGHIGYTMFGQKKHDAIASVSFIILILLGLLGAFELAFKIDLQIGWIGWLIWGMILYYFIKIQHPPIYDDIELNTGRKIIGYLSYFILIISFSPSPFILSLGI